MVDYQQEIYELQHEIRKLSDRQVELLELLKPKPNNITRSQVILDSDEYNGHKTITIPSMDIKDIGKLCKELEEEIGERGDINDMVYFRLFSDYSGYATQDNAEETLLFSVSRVVIDSEEGGEVYVTTDDMQRFTSGT